MYFAFFLCFFLIIGLEGLFFFSNLIPNARRQYFRAEQLGKYNDNAFYFKKSGL